MERGHGTVQGWALPGCTNQGFQMWVGGSGWEKLAPRNPGVCPGVPVHQSQPRVPELCVGLRGWGLGLVWHQAPIRQLESASACPAICPRPPGSRPPSAYPRRPAASAVRPGSLARRGRRRPVLPLFIPISFSALALRTSCQVHEVSLQPRRGGFVVWRWAGKVHECGASFPRFVCSLHWGPLSPTLSISTPTAVFLPFLALVCRSADRAGQLSHSWGSSVHHSLQAS